MQKTVQNKPCKPCRIEKLHALHSSFYKGLEVKKSVQLHGFVFAWFARYSKALFQQAYRACKKTMQKPYINIGKLETCRINL